VDHSIQCAHIAKASGKADWLLMICLIQHFGQVVDHWGCVSSRAAQKTGYNIILYYILKRMKRIGRCTLPDQALLTLRNIDLTCRSDPTSQFHFIQTLASIKEPCPWCKDNVQIEFQVVVLKYFPTCSVNI
jgi:hypothetical protein